MRVLIVEDDLRLARVLQRAFESENALTDVVHDGASAVDAILNREVDLVLLDVDLPEQDGIAVLSTVRAKRPAVRFIMMSARGDTRSRSQALAAGADDFIAKPFGITELFRRVFRENAPEP